MKEELTTLKQELNQKLSEVGASLYAQGQAIAEAEERILGVEAISTVAKEALLRAERTTQAAGKGDRLGKQIQKKQNLDHTWRCAGVAPRATR